MAIELVKLPDAASPSSIKFPVGVGTNFNFNVMLASVERGGTLACGEYVFRYVANCEAIG